MAGTAFLHPQENYSGLFHHPLREIEIRFGHVIRHGLVVVRLGPLDDQGRLLFAVVQEGAELRGQLLVLGGTQDVIEVQDRPGTIRCRLLEVEEQANIRRRRAILCRDDRTECRKRFPRR